MSAISDPVWDVVQTNTPNFPVTCEVCNITARFIVTYRIAFPGMTHRVNASLAERRRHGPGLWVCARCCSVLKATPVEMHSGLGGLTVIVRGEAILLEWPDPQQGDLF